MLCYHHGINVRKQLLSGHSALILAAPINCQTNCVAAEESGGTLIVESQALVIHICSLLQALFGLISTFELGHVISSSISLVQLSL